MRTILLSFFVLCTFALLGQDYYPTKLSLAPKFFLESHFWSTVKGSNSSLIIDDESNFNEVGIYRDSFTIVNRNFRLKTRINAHFGAKVDVKLNQSVDLRVGLGVKHSTYRVETEEFSEPKDLYRIVDVKNPFSSSGVDINIQTIQEVNFFNFDFTSDDIFTTIDNIKLSYLTIPVGIIIKPTSRLYVDLEAVNNILLRGDTEGTQTSFGGGPVPHSANAISKYTKLNCDLSFALRYRISAPLHIRMGATTSLLPVTNDSQSSFSFLGSSQLVLPDMKSSGLFIGMEFNFGNLSPSEVSKESTEKKKRKNS
jgi:hypothetical protein